MYVSIEAEQRQIMKRSRPVHESSTMVIQCDIQKSRTIPSSGKNKKTLFAIIMVKKGIPNNVAMQLLDIQYDEIFQRYHERT